MNYQRMSREWFDDQSNFAQGQDDTTAYLEVRYRQSQGQMPAIHVFGLNGADPGNLLWSEVQLKILATDEIGNFVLESPDGGIAVRGLALWRQTNTRLESNSTVE